MAEHGSAVLPSHPDLTSEPVRPWRLTLIGGFVLEGHGVVVDTPASAQRLLALLALRGPVSRSVAAGTLWPDGTEEHALGSLRTTVWRLRRRCDRLLAVTADQIALADDVALDTVAFLRLAHRLIDGGTRAGPIRPDDLGEVRRLAGELLPGWDEDWACFPREHVRQLHLHVLEELSARLVVVGRYAAALDVAHRAVALDPLRESGHCAVISAHLAEGNYAEALRAYRRFARISVDELGFEPTPHMRHLLGRPLRVVQEVRA